jgi:hypothetical protein
MTMSVLGGTLGRRLSQKIHSRKHTIDTNHQPFLLFHEQLRIYLPIDILAAAGQPTATALSLLWLRAIFHSKIK